MNILRESMTRFTVANASIRVWREEPNAGAVNNSDLRERAIALSSQGCEGVSLAQAMLLMDRVNAVEVLPDGQNGFVVYRLEDDGSF